MTLAACAQLLNGRLHGPDAEFSGVSQDTRTLKHGDLYVALIGTRYDGHAFLSDAARAGASGALVSRASESALAAVRVADTRLSLGELATHWRRKFSLAVIAVTGSNGKTTVKNMIAAIMAETGPGLATQGNLNNDIGVPLTLLRLRNGDRHAVIEMGMNHPGEIAYLTGLTRPNVALITNAGEAHLAGLGSVKNVARAKGEIFTGLADDGVAVINADDPHAGLWRALAAPHACISFGLDQPADVRADYTLDLSGASIHLTTTQGDITMRLPLLGRHNVMNALAAAGASLAAGAQLADIKRGIEKLRAVSGRLELKSGVNGARVLDDTYNANPASLAAGVEVLKDAGGERVLVLGDMAELGEAALDIHRRVGELAQRLGIDRLFALGDFSKLAVKGFGKGGKHFSNDRALVEALRDCMHPRMTVLVKGSRVMRMDQVVEGITAPANGGQR